MLKVARKGGEGLRECTLTFGTTKKYVRVRLMPSMDETLEENSSCP